MAASSAQLVNAPITTNVAPASENIAGLETVSSTPNWLPKKKKQPIKSLSVVIILIGALQLSFGVSMNMAEKNDPSLVSRSGISYLGSLVFIAAGIITVVFASEEKIVKIKFCLISHMISDTFAAIGIVFYAIQVYTDTQACWVFEHGSHESCFPGNSSFFNQPDYNYWSYANYVYVLRVSVHLLVLFYIVVGLVVSSSIILLRWKLLREARYTSQGS